MQVTEIKILQYRNGIYQGQVKNNKRHGQGILITDDNIIITGLWKNDLMSGKILIFLTQNQCGYGQFNRGQIQGFFIFRNKIKTLMAQFNMSRPLNKLFLLDQENQSMQEIIYKNLIFQVANQSKIQGDRQSNERQLSKLLNKQHLYCSLACFLDQLCTVDTIKKKQQSTISLLNQQITNSYFKYKLLQNGTILFYINDPSNPSNLGFILNKNCQLISSGMYINDKLNGLGCKYQNYIKYYGIFDNGFINGMALKYIKGKTCFKKYQDGNQIQGHDQNGEEQLKLLKKYYHIRSIHFINSYIKHNIIKFKGISQLNLQNQYPPPSPSNIKPHKQQILIKHPYKQPITIQNKPNQNYQKNNYYTSNTQPTKKKSKNYVTINYQDDKLQTKSSKDNLYNHLYSNQKDIKKNKCQEDIFMRNTLNNKNIGYQSNSFIPEKNKNKVNYIYQNDDQFHHSYHDNKNYNFKKF